MKLFKTKKTSSKPGSLDEVLGDYELPVFSAPAMSIMKDLRHPDSDLEDVADAIAANPGIMVKVLGMVNSAAFGIQQPVTSVYHAVTLLGRSKVESVVLGVVVKDSLPAPRTKFFDPRRFWGASYRRAALARRLADLLHPAQASECFVMGLLQDMAIPVIASTQAKKYDPVLDHWLNDPERREDLTSLERECLPFTHAEVGRLMGEHWGMPSSLIDAIGNHHDADNPSLLPAVHLVSFVRENDRAPDLEELVEEARDHYLLQPDDVMKGVEEAFEQADSLQATLG